MEQSPKLIELSKIMIDDFKNSCDVTGRWMASYISELMCRADNAEGDLKGKLQRECFDTVLKLWQHKSQFPSDCLPYREYDSVFKTLKRIDPNNPNPFYVKEVAETNEEVKSYIDMALLIDKSVRIWFDCIIRQAIQASTSEISLEYLKATIEMDEDSAFLYDLVMRYDEEDGTTSADELGRNLETLTLFSEFNNEMIEYIKSRPL